MCSYEKTDLQPFILEERPPKLKKKKSGFNQILIRGSGGSLLETNIKLNGLANKKVNIISLNIKYIKKK